MKFRFGILNIRRSIVPVVRVMRGSVAKPKYFITKIL